jgi:uncharacterized iron-regulated protein
MDKIIFLSLFTITMAISVFPQIQITDANYRMFDAKGNSVGIEKIISEIGKSDVVFLGEMHDDATAHFLQAEIFRQTVEKYGANRNVALSLEMFERDIQTVVNEYLNDQISEAQFLAASRPWGNYKTDYRPLVETAKEKKLAVIAANAPRRYVNMVSRLGKDSLKGLTPEAKKWLAPLPYNDASEAYARKFNSLMGQMNDSKTPTAHSPILFSQALWDATMAYSVAQHLKKNKNALIVHLNGGFHTENRLGTVEQLLKYRPKTKVLVVTLRYEDDFQTFDKSKHTDLGDFVILTDAKVPRSQR